jgi:hypothetical protein
MVRIHVPPRVAAPCETPLKRDRKEPMTCLQATVSLIFDVVFLSVPDWLSSPLRGNAADAG